MPDEAIHVISSAVVAVKPGDRPQVAALLRALPGTELHAEEGNKIVVTLEGASRGEVGARLAAIALLDGVITASLVFEHVETLDQRTTDGKVPA